MCGSSQQAVHFAAQAIASGDMDCVIACGVEMMGRVKMGSDWEILPEFIEHFPYKVLHQGQSADMIAQKYQLTREEVDEYSARSHEKCAAARDAGYFKSQILPVKVRTV